jgi:hypothetical protein
MDRKTIVERLRELALSGATVSMLVREITTHQDAQLSDSEFIGLFTEAFSLEPHAGNASLAEWRDQQVEGLRSGHATRYLFPRIIRNQQDWRSAMTETSHLWLDSIISPNTGHSTDTDERLISEWDQLSSVSKEFILRHYREAKRLFQELTWMACLAERLAQLLINNKTHS